MRPPLARVIGDLRGLSGTRFVELLGGHLDTTLDGAELVGRAVRGELDWSRARAEMVGVEHRGDELREALITELSGSIVTPIDREDLFRISRSIDDVLDNLRDFLRECDLFEVDRPRDLEPVASAVSDAIRSLRDATEAIDTARDQVAARALEAKKTGNEIRRRYDAALGVLFAGELDMEVLKVREVLRRLDVVGLRLGEAADALSDAAVKRSAGIGPLEQP
jgi:uncharacterized protein Yka (UPF0111/DUF47 family)